MKWFISCKYKYNANIHGMDLSVTASDNLKEETVFASSAP